jgi:hypothetical protein
MVTSTFKNCLTNRFFQLSVSIASFLFIEQSDAHSQLIVNENATIAQMTSTIQGSGVTISNMVITSGANWQLSSFTNTNAAGNPLTIGNGILLSTGRGSTAVGPNNTGSASVSNGITYNDPDLLALEGLANRDVVILEFDVVPISDTLQLTFQFGSEEYPEYVCSGYNDAFAFFVSGPGIAGPFSGGAENFAQLPGGTYVSIDNVNDVGTCVPNNSAYYTDCTGNAFVQADGFTTNLKVKGTVQPCGTYHVKCAIADAGDQVWDSWVYLDGFQALGQAVAVAPFLSGQQLVEGCNTVRYRATRTGDLSVPLTVNFTYGGTATNGVDYTGAPNSIIFPGGSNEVFFDIVPLIDALSEGSESVTLNATWNICSQVVTANFPLTISDRTLTTSCPSNITVNATAGQCSAPVTYTTPTVTDACSPCPAPTSLTGYNLIGTFNGRTYFKSTTAQTWVNAHNSAAAVGAHLATVTSAAEQAWLAGATAGPAWIGYTDRSVENTFIWVTGESSGYTNWCSLQPNNLGNEDFVEWNGCWSDRGAATTNFSLIEFDCSQSLTSGFTSGSNFPVGTTTVTHQANNGQTTASCSFNVTVVDTQGPTITCPANVSQNTSGANCFRNINTANPVTSDNCGVTVLTWVLTGATTGSSAATGINNLPPTIFNAGTTTVTYTAQDAAGNSTNCSFTVTVVDSQNPTITCPANITNTVTAGTCSRSIATTNPTTGDNCSVTTLTWVLTGATTGTSAATGINNLGTQTFNLGVTTVTYTVRDAANNSATCSYTVTITDNIAPTITCPANLSATVAPGTCTASVATANPTTADNCAVTRLTWAMTGATTASSPVTGINNVGTYTFNGGVTTITYSVFDAAGNTTTCSFTVTVNDNIAPTAVCQNYTVNLNAGGTATITAANINNGSTDNCGIASMTVSPSTFNCTNVSTPLVVTSTDGYTVTINMNAISVNPASMSCASGYNYTVTLGYTVTFSGINIPASLFTLQGNLTCTPATSFFDLPNTGGTGTTNTSNAWTTLTNCATVTPSSLGCNSLTIQIEGPGIPNQTLPMTLVSNPVTLTVTDNSGNVSTCSSNVTVLDAIAPTITCPANITNTTTAGVCSRSIATANPTTADNCAVTRLTWVMTGATTGSSASTGINNLGTQTFNLGTTTVTYTAQDASGNSSTCSFTVVITDSILPTITCPANISQNVTAGTCSRSVATTNPTTGDNCAVTILTWAMTGATTGSSAATGINNLGTQTFNLGVTTVTYTVRDAANNTATCSFTVTITDNINPTITCPANISQNVTAGTCSRSVATTNPTTGDNCAVTILTWAMTGATTGSSAATGINNLGTQTFNAGVTTVTYTVRDAANNTATCSFTVTITDNINPTITCPANISQNVTAGTCSRSVATTNPTTGDNCAVTILTWAMTGATTGSSAATGINNLGTQTFNAGVTTVTYTVRDAANNTATCSFTVTITDNINPTITCPANISQNVTAGTCSRSVATTNPTTGDNCAVTILTWAMTGATTGSSAATGINNLGTQTFNAGVTTVTYTVRDAANNTATCSFTVTITDNINPTITCPANISQNVTAGTCSRSVATTNPTTGDNCAVTILTWAMTGATTGSSAATGINNLGTQTFNAGVTTVTYTVRDAANNTATCSFTVTITDNINPTITCPANISQNVTAGTCSRSVATTNPTTGDNCAVTILTWAMTGATTGSSAATGINNLGTQTFNAGVTTVTYTVRDAANNTATCSFTVTITDNINPTITCPANISQNVTAGTCSRSVATTNPTTGDNCAVTILTWAMTGATTGSSAATGINNLGTQTFNAGVTTVTYTVRDAANNTATCSFTVTITDNINPTITCPANIIQNTAVGTCTASVVTPNPTTGDNCGVTRLTWAMTGATTGASAATGINNLGTQTFNLGVTTITYTVRDAANNTATCSFTVTITDNINPTITCPANITVNVGAGTCTATVLAAALGTPTTADNCSVASVSNNHPSTTYTLGANSIVWTVTDGSGNTATCTQTVTVVDNINPTITCPANITVNVGAGTCTATVLAAALGTPTTADNCSVASVSNNHPSTTYTLGANSVVWTVTDGSGNTATCTQTVTVVDNINPTITCPANITVNVGAGTCTATVLAAALGTPTTADNCSVASVSNNHPSTTYTLGANSVVWTVTDGSGNTATCTQTVTVVDNINPTITCPANITNTVTAGTCSRSIATTNPTTADNCSVTVLTWAMTGATTGASAATGINNLGTQTFNLGVTTVTYTVRDAANNTATCSFTVTITDNINPTITCPANITVNVGAGTCTATVLAAALGTPTTADNCSVASVSNNHPSTTYTLGANSVVWTVTDGSGNTATCTQTVTVIDNINPTITCPANITVNVGAGTCTATVLAAALGTPTTADNCSVASVSNNHPSTTYTLGANSVIWTVTDGSGNTATCTQTVTVVDNINPTITCPANITVNVGAGTCTATVLAAALGTPTTADNCSVATVTNNHPSTTYTLGANSVVWTVTDGSGNTATCTQTVTVVDNINPTITCPANITVNVGAGTCTATVLAAALGTPTTADNCSVASVSNNHPSTTYTLGANSVVWTVTDGSGNTATCTQTVTVVDNIVPTITCPANITVNVGAGTCTATVLAAALGTPTTADNCSVASVSNNHPSTTYTLGANSVVWTVTDGSGNTATCTQTVTVVDNINPTITCPANITVNVGAGSCTATVLAAALGTPTTADNCSVATVTNNHPSTTYTLGANSVVWTVTDGSGNTATCTQTVTVVDNINPTITCPTNITVNVGAGTCTATVLAAALGTPTTADNCSVASVTNNHPSTTYTLGANSVVWTVTDGSGNTATCTQTVTVVDNINPTITCPANITVNVGAGTCTATVLAAALGTPTTADNCSVASVTNNHPSTTYTLGANSVVWTVTDGSGNTATCTQTVTVVDNINPTITCPANITVNVGAGTCTATVLAAALGTPTTADNCSVASVSNNHPSTAYSLGANSVVWTVTDGSGNTATCTQTVTVVDNILPTITCPANITNTVTAGTCSRSIATTNPTTADNCSVTVLTWAMTGATTGASAATGINNLGTQTFNLGVTTVTYTVRDAANNTATCSFTVTITDNIVPTITCPANITVNVGAGTCTATVLAAALGTPTTADNCSVASVSNNHPSTTYTLGANSVVWTVTDGSGNTATCTQTVTVVDNINPTITCPANITVNVGAGTCTATVLAAALGTPTTADNCSVASVSNNHPSTTYTLGSNSVVWTVTDGSGNTATCTQTVTVVDNINPTITCPANITVNVGAGTCTATVLAAALGTPTTADNCSVASVTNNHPSTTYTLGANSVVWTVTDGSGNTATCTQTVTVVDNINPTITCPANITVNVGAGTCTATVLAAALGTPTTADNCSVASVTNNHPSTTYTLGANSVVWTVTDGSGNTATCTQTVTVVDNINPTITCPANITVNVGAGTCTATVLSAALGTPTTADNCSVASVTNNHPSTTYTLGANSVIWTVTDGSGNTATCTQTVTVVDNINPTITCPANITVNVGAGTPTTAEPLLVQLISR